MERWDVAAWLCFWQPRMTKQQLSVEQFNPMRRKQEIDNVDAATRLREMGRKIGLPKSLTPEERRARFEWFQRRQEDRAARQKKQR